MLRPLSSMNAAAKRAASGDLSQRLALSGPRDEIHDLADTFDNMLASLERSFSVHRRFAANASHELRTPLATTQTMIDVALSDPQASAEDLRRVLTRVLETNRANRETIDALLDLADAQSGKLAREDVDMEATVRDALSVIAPEVAEHDLQVSTHLLPARVPGDPVLLRQSVSNLLRNAARYNVDGGRITVGMAHPDDGVRLTIRNDGPLVAAESVESLREPFVRGEGRGRTGCGHRPRRSPRAERQPRRRADRRPRDSRRRGRTRPAHTGHQRLTVAGHGGRRPSSQAAGAADTRVRRGAASSSYRS